MKLVWKIVGWVISLFFLLMALVYMFESVRGFFTGLLFLIGAIITNPLCISIIERYTGFSLKKTVIGLVAFFSLIAGAFAAPTSEKTITEEAIVSENENIIFHEEEAAKVQREQEDEMKAKDGDEVAKKAELVNQQKEEVQKTAETTVSTLVPISTAVPTPTAVPTSTPAPTPEPTPIPVETPKFKVKDISSTMYASSNVNVRSAPDASETKLGSLTKNQEVSVTGLTDNGWYRIEYGNMDGYVRSDLLLATLVVETTQANNSTSSGTNSNVSTNDSTGNNKSNNISTGNSNIGSSSNSSGSSSSTTGTYIVNATNGKVHYYSCRKLPGEGNRIYFATKEDVINAGYDDTCGICKPRL